MGCSLGFGRLACRRGLGHSRGGGGLRGRFHRRSRSRLAAARVDFFRSLRRCGGGLGEASSWGPAWPPGSGLCGPGQRPEQPSVCLRTSRKSRRSDSHAESNAPRTRRSFQVWTQWSSRSNSLSRGKDKQQPERIRSPKQQGEPQIRRRHPSGNRRTPVRQSRHRAVREPALVHQTCSAQRPAMTSSCTISITATRVTAKRRRPQPGRKARIERPESAAPPPKSAYDQ